MRTGPKGSSPAEKKARGTFQPVRHADVVQIVEPTALPLQPEWLTEDGRQVWLDNIGRVSSVHGAREVDSDLFANFCNLQGAVAKVWRSGEVPPITALMETRKLMEMLRIAGPSSRVVKIDDGTKPSGNPFLKRRA